MREATARRLGTTLAGFPLPDLLLAAAFCVIAVASVLTRNPNEGPLWLTLPTAIATTAALAWRVRNGIVATALIVAASAVQTVMSQAPGSLWSLAVYGIVMYSVGAHYAEAIAGVVGAALVAALLIEERIDSGVDYLFILLLFGGIWLLGRASRYWRGRVSVAEQRQRDTARLAVAEERVRIARDLHDVVAHSLSVIAVQSDAAEAALEHDPPRAAEPVRAIRSTARGALGEMRQLLDLLRTDDAQRPGSASPGISAIDGLVGAARAAGTPVEYSAMLTDAPLSPAVDLATYRVVQEALTNVIKHAAGAATRLVVEQSAESLHVSIANKAPEGAAPISGAAQVHGANLPEQPGYGLIGIRERIRAVGGTVAAMPTQSGGFEVVITVPLPAASAVPGAS